MTKKICKFYFFVVFCVKFKINFVEALLKTQSKITPYVELDANNGVFKIAGKSFPEDVLLFYTPIRNWISEYCDNPNEQTEFIFDLEYFNSATARIIIKILLNLEEIMNMNKSIHVFWHYKKGDEVMRERGEEIKSVILLPFELIENE